MENSLSGCKCLLLLMVALIQGASINYFDELNALRSASKQAATTVQGLAGNNSEHIEPITHGLAGNNSAHIELITQGLPGNNSALIEPITHGGLTEYIIPSESITDDGSAENVNVNEIPLNVTEIRTDAIEMGEVKTNSNKKDNEGYKATENIEEETENNKEARNEKNNQDGQNEQNNEDEDKKGHEEDDEKDSEEKESNEGESVVIMIKQSNSNIVNLLTALKTALKSIV